MTTYKTQSQMNLMPPKEQDLELIVTIDGLGWVMKTSSDITCVPDNREYRFRLGNHGQVSVKGSYARDTDTVDLIHQFLISSFSELAIIYSQFKSTCEYRLTFSDDKMDVSFKESLKNLAWSGTLHLDGRFELDESRTIPHCSLYELFDDDAFTEVLKSIENFRYERFFSDVTDDHYEYAM